MKVKIGNTVKDYRTVWLDGRNVKMINQPLLPHAFQIATLRNHVETAKSISTMIVRGGACHRRYRRFRHRTGNT